MIASHLIFSAHGFWLPNDPRGSWSTYIRSYELFLAGGPARTVTTRRSIAHAVHDRQTRLRTKEALKHPPIRFSAEQAKEIVVAFKGAVSESDYVMHALAVMPDHVHTVVASHANPPQRIIGHLKARATQRLLELELHPFAEHRYANGRYPEMWAHQAWKVFLDEPEEVERAIRYVNDNPPRAGMLRQRYTFLTPFDR